MSATPTFRQRLLGGFIVVQIVFLLAANFLPLLPHGRPDPGEMMDDVTISGRTFDSDALQAALHVVGTTTRRYGELTGQMQGWSLFAPLVAPQSPFLVTELRWRDADGRVVKSEKIRSRFEPADPHNYVTPLGDDVRLFNYEFRVSHAMWFLTDEALAERPEQWKAWMPARVTKQQRSLRAYLRMQADEFAKTHPNLPPPNELLLAVRVYPIAPPGAADDFDATPIERPMVRWRPAMKGLDRAESLEYFDPVDREFIAVKSLGAFSYE